MERPIVVRYSDQLPQKYSGKKILVDTSALIEASFSSEFLDFLLTLLDHSAQLYTIQEVVYEFTRGANDRTQYEKYKQLIKDLGISVLEKVPVAPEQDAFFFVFYHEAGNRKNLPSCTDYSLCLELFEGKDDWTLLSGNHRDIPTSIFDRNDLVTIDKGKELHIEALYSLNRKHYETIRKRLYK